MGGRGCNGSIKGFRAVPASITNRSSSYQQFATVIVRGVELKLVPLFEIVADLYIGFLPLQSWKVRSGSSRRNSSSEPSMDPTGPRSTVSSRQKQKANRAKVPVPFCLL